MRLLLSLLAGLSAFLGLTAAWWAAQPVWESLQVEAQVKSRLPHVAPARFSNVTYNKATRTGCGYVNTVQRPGSAPVRTHFMLLPDGSVMLDPSDRLQGPTLHRLEVLGKHTNYLSQVYNRCAQG
jgi:hypothetical protein